MKKHVVFSLFLILLFSCFVSSSAQIAPQIYRVVPPQQDERDDYHKNLDLVDELLRTGKGQEALQVLEQMKGVYGETVEVHQFYKAAYLSLKQYDRVEQIIKNDLAQSPSDWKLYTELANVYLKSDKEEDAKLNLNKAIELVPESIGAYREVALVYLRNGLTSESMDTYKLARMKLNDPRVFSLDLAGLYEGLFDYKQAIDEYFLFMGEDTTKFNVVEDRINRLIQSEQNLDQVEMALGERIKKNPKDRYSQKLYGDLLFRTGKLDAAFESYKKVDELSGAKGRTILGFVGMCHNNGYFDQAAQASSYLVQTEPSKEVVVSAMIYIAYSQEGQEKYNDAINTYQSIIDQYGSTFPLEASLSHYMIGKIMLNDLRKPQEAYTRFRIVISGFKDAPLSGNALVRLGDCKTASGDPDSARILFEKALRDPRGAVNQEELKFKLAELEFYRGDFESSLEGYNQLISDFPKGLYVNNCLERTVVINENQELDRPLLTKFARAMLNNVEGQVDSAITKLDELISMKSEKLSDLAQLEKAKILKQEKKYDQSLKAFNELLEKFPESLFRSQAQMLIGDIYNFHLHDKPKAIEAYEKLLKDYDRSVYADEVRDKLRELQAEISPASSG